MTPKVMLQKTRFGLAQRLTLLIVGVVLASLAIVAAGVEYERREYSSKYRDVQARSAAALVYSARRLLVAVPPSQRREIARALTASGTVQLFPDAERIAPPPSSTTERIVRADAEDLREAILRYATQPAEVVYREDPTPRFWIRQFIDGEPWWVVVLMSELPQGSGATPWAALLLVLSLVIVASGIYAASLTRPLERLSAAVGQIGDDWPEPLEPVGPRELQQLTHSFNSMIARLKEIERERAVLLGGIPHDLRAPLTRMRMRIAMMPQSEELHGIEADVVAMERIVRQFGDFLRDASRADEKWSALGALVDEIVAGYRVLGHDVTLELLAEPTLLVPEMTVRRVLENLLGNAVEHGRPPIAVRIEIRPDAHRLVLQVSDHGDGIPEALEHDARSPFVKLDRARGTAGCGLGLAIVQQLVTRAGGELSFIREAGRFTVLVVLGLGRNNSQ